MLCYVMSLFLGDKGRIIFGDSKILEVVMDGPIFNETFVNEERKENILTYAHFILGSFSLFFSPAGSHKCYWFLKKKQTLLISLH